MNDSVEIPLSFSDGNQPVFIHKFAGRRLEPHLERAHGAPVQQPDFQESADISETGCSPRFSEAGKEGGVLIFLPEEGYLYSHIHSVRRTVEEIEKQGPGPIPAVKSIPGAVPFAVHPSEVRPSSRSGGADVFFVGGLTQKGDLAPDVIPGQRPGPRDHIAGDMADED